MEKVNSLRELALKKQLWRNSGFTWGFVPTMGALHEGHASLIRAAAAAHEIVVVSIFVNPTQFNDPEDFKKYPLTPDADCRVAEAAGATVLFTPTAEDIYGGQIKAQAVDYGQLTTAFEAAERPGHFDGVVAVVDLLFQAVEPSVAYFGEKDLQQVAVVRRLAEERHPAVRIACQPLVRDHDGLALSSRNVRLMPEARQRALAISRTLAEVKGEIFAGRDVQVAVAEGRAKLEGVAGLDLAYFEAIETDTFQTQFAPPHAESHLICAATVDGVRLIDNIRLTPRPEPAIVP